MSAQELVPEPGARSGAGWQFALFPAWRERECPQSSYQISPPVWRPEWQSQAEGVRDRTRQALKNWEPRLTGMAYSDRIVHLVQVVDDLRAEQIGRMLYLADLFRGDPDYAELEASVCACSCSRARSHRQSWTSPGAGASGYWCSAPAATRADAALRIARRWKSRHRPNTLTSERLGAGRRWRSNARHGHRRQNCSTLAFLCDLRAS